MKLIKEQGMNKFNSRSFIIRFILILFVFVMVLVCNASETTTTAGAAPSSTSGTYFPSPKNIDQNPKTKLPQKAPITNPANSNLVCVDSGVQGRRCGIMAVSFCKLNPDAQNCKALLDKMK